MKLVVDASVALKWFLRERDDEADVPAALGILQDYAAGRHEVLQPVHFRAEVCGVLARVAPAQARENFRDLCDLDMPSRDDEVVLWRAMQISQQLGHHLFDTLYHAVALETDGATLVTADHTYWRKSHHLGRVVLLSDWAAVPPPAAPVTPR